MRITTTLLALATTALFAAGCSDSNAPKTDYVGRYALVSVNDQPVPFTVIDDPSLTLVLMEGGLTLKANNGYTMDVSYSVTAEGFPTEPQQVSCDGTYHRSGNTFTLTGIESDECDGTIATGTLDGNTLTVTDDTGEVLVFRR